MSHLDATAGRDYTTSSTCFYRRDEFRTAYELACKNTGTQPRADLQDVLCTQPPNAFKLQRSSLSAPVSNMDTLVLCEALKTLSCKVLDLGYNALTATATRSIAELMQSDAGLTELHLVANDISGDGGGGGNDDDDDEHATNDLTKFIDTVGRCGGSMHTLDLSDNPLGDASIVQLANTALALQSCGVRRLSIANTQCGIRGIIALCEAVLRRPAGLECLNIDRPSFRSVEDDTAVHIAAMLNERTALWALSMAKHGMYDSGMLWIIDSLRHNLTLRELNVSCNRLGPPTLHRLLEVLIDDRECLPPSFDDERARVPDTVCALETLDLSGNHLAGDDCAQDLYYLIRHNRTLHSINLSNCGLTDRALLAIATALPLNKAGKLCTLSLRQNTFGAQSRDAFAKLLDKTTAAAAAATMTSGAGGDGRLSLRDQDFFPIIAPHNVHANINMNGGA